MPSGPGRDGEASRRTAPAWRSGAPPEGRGARPGFRRERSRQWRSPASRRLRRARGRQGGRAPSARPRRDRSHGLAAGEAGARREIAAGCGDAAPTSARRDRSRRSTTRPQRSPRQRPPSGEDTDCEGASDKALRSRRRASYDQSPPQPAAPDVDDEHQRNQRVEVRPDLAVVKVLERRRDVVAERREAEEAENSRGAQRALETVEGIGAKIGKGARKEAEEKDLERRSACRAKGLGGVTRRFLDHHREALAERSAEREGI